MVIHNRTRMGILAVAAIQCAAASFDVGENHVCATVGNTPKCWGGNVAGQLGRGDRQNIGDDIDEMGDNLEPVNVSEIVTDFALGQSFTCALLTSESVKCFGHNDKGQLGQEDNENRGDDLGELGVNLTAVDFGTGLTAVQIATGCSHTCAILDDGSVKCFGYNNDGQLGQGTTEDVGTDVGHMGENLQAVDLGGSTATAIAAGCDFTCVIVDDSVKCWGLNDRGQLGSGDNENLLDDPDDELVEVDLNGDIVTAIAAGGSHACALLDDNTVKCWGRNGQGQLGQGDDVDRGDSPTSMGENLAAVAFDPDDVPQAIACGMSHTCVLFDGGSIKCFGSNGAGELGIESTVSSVGELPTEMGTNLTAVLVGEASEVAAGSSVTCARLADDSIKCWGDGANGALGQGNDEGVGTMEGDMQNLTAVDLGSDILMDTLTPAPTSLVTTTLSPLGPGETHAPTSSAENDTIESSGAAAHLGGLYVRTGVMIVAGCVLLLM